MAECEDIVHSLSNKSTQQINVMLYDFLLVGHCNYDPILHSFWRLIGLWPHSCASCVIVFCGSNEFSWWKLFWL